MKARTYIAIDLKSFYASVECVERGLDPMDAHLVVGTAQRRPSAWPCRPRAEDPRRAGASEAA